MLKWLLVVIVAVALSVGGIALYLTNSGEGLPWQTAVQEPSKTDGDKTPTLAPGQSPQPKTTGPAWALNCRSGAQDKALNCRLSQRVVMKGSGRLLAQVTFLLPAAKQKEAQLNIRLPLGVLVSAGTTVQVDGNPPQNLRIRTCDRGGCYARTALSSELLAQLRKGSKLTVAFKNLTEKTISLPLSLGGFAEAYAKAQDV